MNRTYKKIFIILFTLLILAAIYIYVILKPSNSRNWEFGMETLPHFKITDSTVTVSHIRDNEYTGKEFKLHFFDHEYETKNISKVWFVVSKFSGFSGIAHTYFIFDMKDSDPITVSVEARREKGEDYSIPGGLFNKFELMYVWASERDSVVRRTVIGKDKVYMYPLAISDSAAQQLFLQLARRSESIETAPRFYNTLLSNCTNELAKSANDVKPGTIPLTISLILPGYSARDLYKLGYITGEGSIEQIESKHYITDFVSHHYMDGDLTNEIRSFLLNN